MPELLIRFHQKTQRLTHQNKRNIILNQLVILNSFQDLFQNLQYLGKPNLGQKMLNQVQHDNATNPA